MNDIVQLRLLEPDMVIWLLIIPAMVILCLVHISHKRNFRVQAGLVSSLKALSNFSSNKKDGFVLIITLLIIALLIIALSRPQLYVEKIEPEYEKQDLVLILDRSVSMHAEDVLPSRFSRAIREIKSFLSDKPELIDRVGLVGFANTSVVLSHLGRDLGALFFLLDWLADDQEVYYGTNVEEAISSALEMIRKDETDTHKTFLLLSDGDDQSAELAEYLVQLNNEGIKIHTIGIGSEQSVPIPLSSNEGNSEFLADEAGNQILTRFNESTLRLVASMTQGTFFRSTTGHDLADSLNQVVLQEQRQIGWKRSVEYMDIYIPLLMFACAATFLLLIKV